MLDRKQANKLSYEQPSFSLVRASVNSVLLAFCWVVAVLNSSSFSTLLPLGHILFILLLLSVVMNLTVDFKALVVCSFVLAAVFLCLIVNLENIQRSSMNVGFYTLLAFFLMCLKVHYFNTQIFVRILQVFVVMFLLGSLILWFKGVYFQGTSLTPIRPYGGMVPLYGLFSNANSMGAFLFTCLMLTVSVIGRSTWSFLTLSVVVILLALTLSRSAIFAALIGSFVTTCIYLLHRRVAKPSWVVIVPAAFAVISVVGAVLLSTHLDTLFYKVTSSGLTKRDVLWSASLGHQFESLQSVFFGTGPATNLIYLTPTTALSAHNSYINEMANYGILFLFAVLIFFVFIFCRAVVARNYGYLFSVISILAYGMTETALFSGASQIWITFLIVHLVSGSWESVNAPRCGVAPLIPDTLHRHV